jgi:hypothetical protein
VSQRSNSQLRQRSIKEQSDRQKSESVCKVRMHRTIQCATGLSGAARRQKTSTINSSKPQRSTDMVHTGQWTVQYAAHHRTIRCAHQQQSQPTTRKWLEAINTPNHLHSSHPSFSLFSFNTRAKNILQRHNQSIQSSPSSKIKSSDQKSLVTWERVICVSFVALVSWLLSSSHSNLSKWFVKLVRDT